MTYSNYGKVTSLIVIKGDLTRGEVDNRQTNSFLLVV